MGLRIPKPFCPVAASPQAGRADLFSSVLARIQTLMLQKDIEQLSDPNFIPDGSSTVYIIFMIIGCDKKSYRIDCSDTDYQLIAV